MRLDETELSKVDADDLMQWLQSPKADQFIRILLNQRDRLMVAAAESQMDAQRQAWSAQPSAEFQKNYLAAVRYQTAADVLDQFRTRPHDLIGVTFIATANERSHLPP